MHTCNSMISRYLFDHDTGEVAVLERGVGRVLGCQARGQLQIQFVEFVHLLQSQFCLAGPVSGDKPGVGWGEGDGMRERESQVY